MPAASETRIGDYVATDTIFEDDATALYRAKHVDTGKKAIIRALIQDKSPLTDLARLRHEYEISHGLRIECVARALSYDIDDVRPYVVLEDFNGTLISGEIVRETISQQQFLQLAIQLANAVGELHRELIIHKNIKPANILWNRRSGAVCLIDLGFASRLTTEHLQARPGGQVEGSVAYMSPEQTGRINRNVDNRTDLYALGATFFEILTGRPPFYGDDLAEIVHAQIARLPTPVRELRPDVSPIISEIVAKLLEKDADDRYQSTYGLRSDLEKCNALLVLDNANHISSFPLGQRDITQGFRVSGNIFGRDDEIERLRHALALATGGQQSTAIVRGPPGIGKTAIVQELRKPVEDLRGFFLSGKYDQLESNSPYSGILQAFRGFIRTMLASSDATLAHWRKTIRDAVGVNGGVVAEILPELEVVIGPQPSVASLAPTESRNRFNRTWQQLLGAIAAPGRPLVIFLDDLQWADSASMAFIQHVLLDRKLANTLLVAAYRDQDVTSSHRLASLLERIQQDRLPVEVIDPPLLTTADIAAWIQDTLRNQIKQIDEIAALLHEKTGGNPYYAIEFFRSMHRGKLFSFDEENNQWVFDLPQIGSLYATENVVDLMLKRIEALPPGRRQILTNASCISDTFNLNLLLAISTRTPNEVYPDLIALVQEGLVRLGSDYQLSLAKLDVASGGNFDSAYAECHFPHDKVRQAAYSLLSEEDRKKLHLKIGTMLLQYADSYPSEVATTAVDHLNTSRAGPMSPNDRVRLSRLNFEAGMRAKDAVAAEIAHQYFSVGCEVMGDDGWDTDHELSLKLHLGLAETLYLTGDTGQAEALSQRLLARCDNAAEKLKVYERQIILYTSLSRYEEAIRTAVAAAPLVGLGLTDQPSNLHIGREILVAKAKLFGKTDEQLLDMPMMRDKSAVAQMHFLTLLVAPAFLSNPNLAILVALKMFNGSLRYGMSKESPLGYMIYGVASAGTGDFATAARFGNLALRLSERLETVDFPHVLKFLYATAINHWHNHARENLAYLEQSYDESLSAGDFVYADYSLITNLVDGFFLGEPLDETRRRSNRYFDFFRSVKRVEPTESSQGVSALIHSQLVAALMGKIPDPASLSSPELSEESLREAVCDELTRFGLCCAKLQLLFLFGAFDTEPPEIEEGRAALSAVRVMADVRFSEYCLYASLIMLRLLARGAGADARRYRKFIRANRSELKKWARFSPENYQCRYLLLEAEWARSEGNHAEAQALYEQAIKSAQDGHYHQITALACELAARYYLDRGNRRIAAVYLADALYAFRKWGADAKVRWMEREYADLGIDLPATASASQNLPGSVESLDLNAVLKAGAALSGEIDLDRLIRKLLLILVENAGADKAVIVRHQDDRWHVEGTCWLGENVAEPEFFTPAEPVEAGSDDLPISAFNYTVRTRETLLIGDATIDEDYRNDPYVIAKKPKSVLVVPLIHQGNMTSIIYLQNALASRAFTPNRIEFVKLLAGQAAISLENARLFKHQQQLTDSAGSFVPHEFLQLIDKKGLEEAELGDGVQRDMVIMFADIRGFTTISEKMTPRESFEFINAFFQIIGPAIRSFNGFVGKYLGDGIMAFFPHSCDDAINAAFETLRRLNGDDAPRLPSAEQMRIGIGLHFGSVMLGIVGEEKRVQCDAVSDAANVTARIEELTKVYGVSLIVSNQFFEGLKNAQEYRYRSLGKVDIIGRHDPIEILEVYDLDPDEVAKLKDKTRADFERAIAAFAEQRYEKAHPLFTKVLDKNPDDRPARAYLDTIEKRGRPEIEA